MVFIMSLTTRTKKNIKDENKKDYRLNSPTREPYS
jgi:hypothetical protein